MPEKPTILLDFCGFWNSFDKNRNLFVRILSRHFDVKLSENPDFVICSNRGAPFEYMKYDCVRIMFMGENLSPDFSIFDYCIGFDFLEFGDRYFRLPFGLYFNGGEPWIPQKLTKEQAVEILMQKKYFCNFIYGHPSSDGMREKLFYELSGYRDVVSPGSFLNNLNGSKKRCSWKEKHDYLTYSKFTIACESVCYPGFVTEKIVDPFLYHSIPIYYGSTRIGDDFNQEAFVCCEGEESIKRTIERVRYLDTHDEAYIDMLMQQPFATEDYTQRLYHQLEMFLVNIFSQQRQEAYRRVRYFCAENHENHLKNYMRRYQRMPYVLHRLKEKLF